MSDVSTIRERRGDHNTAATVSRGIFLASYFGTPAGAKFMATFGVPIDVSRRVLASSSCRRAHGLVAAVEAEAKAS